MLHGGVFVDAVDCIASFGVELAENNVAAKMGCADNDGNETGVEGVDAEFHGAADVADVRGAVKR